MTVENSSWYHAASGEIRLVNPFLRYLVKTKIYVYKGENNRVRTSDKNYNIIFNYSVFIWIIKIE